MALVVRSFAGPVSKSQDFLELVEFREDGLEGIGHRFLYFLFFFQVPLARPVELGCQQFIHLPLGATMHFFALCY